MSKPTPLYQLIEDRLGQSLAEFVAVRRGEHIRPPTPWRAIAEEITERTGIEVTHTSLRLWFADRQPEPTGGAR